MLNTLLNRKQSEIAKTQLLDLLSQVDNAVQDGTIVAIEQINAAVQAAISKACKDIYAPIFKVNPVAVSTTPDPDAYNAVFNQLISDISTVFSELKYTGDIVVANFNRLVDEEKSILARTKKLYNQLQDLDLFSNTVASRALYVSDDFIDFDNIDFDDRFRENEMCFVDVDQGLITLPYVQATSAIIVSDVKINEISNGVVGNNQQLDVARHGDINEILDSNSDTWFEYEKVHVVATEEPLVLSLTLTLSDEYIINHIRVNPNNFGTSNWVKILSLETSTDDRTYTSIKDNLPVEGFIQIIDEDDFTLSPATSKYSGQGIYTFTPRKARHVRIVLEQSQGYYIDTTDGQRFRYAIGLRDIEVHAIKFQATGSIVSLPFALTEEIRKVSLLAVENPVRASDIASIEHYISVDDGATWHQLQVQTGEDQELPKILTFNDESEGAITTDVAPLTVRHKAILKRDSDGFKSDKSAISEIVTSTAELRQLPAGEPFSVNVSQRPVAGSVRIVNPIFGSKGWTSPRLYVGTSDGTPGQTFEVEIDIREGEEKLYVDSQLWTSVTTFDADYQYIINYEYGEEGLPLIKFGFDYSVPPRGAIISIELPAELAVVEGKEPHLIVLENMSDGDKNATEVIRYSPRESIYGERMAQAASRHFLQNQNISDEDTVTFKEPAGSNVFADEKTFIDGVTELADSGDYSIDYTNGIIYSKDATPSVGITSVSYKYTPVQVVPVENWKFSDQQTFQSIEIDHSVFRSVKVEDEDLSSQVGQLRVTLANETVVRGSLRWSSTASLITEVPFIDGVEEFSDTIRVEDESVPSTGTSFTLDNVPSDEYPVVFSDTAVFNTETPTPTDPGDYYVNYTTGEVTTISTLNNGTVSYRYVDSNRAGDLAGAYSIDYREGVVYLYDPLASSVTVSYEYTRYAVRYRVAKKLEPYMYKVNPDDKMITITDPSVLEDYLPTTRHAGLIKVFYDYVEQVRESIEELEPFFTPILKGYALKILTPGLL
jgi:hypothetical protein